LWEVPGPCGLLVRYTGVSGESEFAGVVLLEALDSPERVVHGYFEDFFARGTVFEDGVYYSADGTEAVRVNGWEVVPPEDYRVLRKYL
ncbi:hypothetical protein, partial [Desulfofundulus sp.]|uniref:hypothetical protein n=1 Tax=Desulfofundulus sp. TaxID=2282750 RepID=UPI003C720E0E